MRTKIRFLKRISPLEKGFTLVELLVVLAIIGILTSIVIGSYNSFGQRVLVKNEALELKAELRKYQTYAFATQKNPLPENPVCDSTTVRVDYYSISITSGLPGTPGSYEVSMHCSDISDPTNPIIMTPPLLITDVWPWPSDFSAIVGHNTNEKCSSIEIRYLPLNQGVQLFCGTIPETNQVFVSLTNGSIRYKVFITPSGRVYEQRL